jgi:hypothetical protein
MGAAMARTDGEDDDGGLHCEKWTGVKGDCGVGGWMLCRKNRLLGVD